MALDQLFLQRQKAKYDKEVAEGNTFKATYDNAKEMSDRLNAEFNQIRALRDRSRATQAQINRFYAIIEESKPINTVISNALYNWQMNKHDINDVRLTVALHIIDDLFRELAHNANLTSQQLQDIRDVVNEYSIPADPYFTGMVEEARYAVQDAVDALEERGWPDPRTVQSPKELWARTGCSSVVDVLVKAGNMYAPVIGVVTQSQLADALNETAYAGVDAETIRDELPTIMTRVTTALRTITSSDPIPPDSTEPSTETRLPGRGPAR